MQTEEADPIREVLDGLASESYVADASIATSIYMAQALERPLLIEGRAGVGKTEIANVMARLLDTKLIRLQCYEGLDVTTALYEWNYPKQLLWIKLGRHRTSAPPVRRRPRYSTRSSCWSARSWLPSRRPTRHPSC